MILYPQIRDRRIRRLLLGDDVELFLYAIPAFPFIVAYTVSELPDGDVDGVVDVRALIDR